MKVPTPQPALSGESNEPVTLLDALLHEITELSGSKEEPPDKRPETLKEHFRRLGEPGAPSLSALCLSGGGIRSATFNLGILQQLARLRLLGRFDYLSSVSGGGYIATWLRTWMFRVGSAEVLKQLTEPTGDPLNPESSPLSQLRAYSNYLTPKLGLFSGDTWSAAAIVLRNLLLNWLVIVPLLACLIGLPQLFLLVVKGPGPILWVGNVLLGLALFVELIASVLIYRLRQKSRTSQEWMEHPRSQATFVVWCVLPVCLAAALLSTAALYIDATLYEGKWQLWAFSFVWCVGIPIVGWSLSRPHEGQEASANTAGPDERQPRVNLAHRASWLYELIALFVSGSIATVLLTAVTTFWYSGLRGRPGYYVILVLPILLGLYLIARALFVGGAGLSEGVRSRTRIGASDDNDREWWARLSGWILLIIVTWVVVTAICLFGGHLPDYLASLTGVDEDPPRAFPGRIIHWVIAALGAVSGTASARLSFADNSSAGETSRPEADSLTRKILQRSAIPVFAVCLITLLSWGVSAVGAWLIGKIHVRDAAVFSFAGDFMGEYVPVEALDILVFSLLLLVFVGIAVLAGYAVNVNRFSLHGMYRNRLVRAYLGASNLNRKADPFTGFSWQDNPKLHELWRPEAERTATRPLPIINTALNLVSGKQLAWQQRKAASFSMTPFHCGNPLLGYRPTRQYGGPGGISVGTAITISGAAANPNMGYNSSPVLAFLMTLFNVRLGAWVGNPSEHGSRTWKWAGPRQALTALLAELLGMTSETHPYVNLSDGGHFDNLGVYEVVLRRCRQIVVCDAARDTERDGSFTFEDLGNAIRKVRIDFGIRIEFLKKIRIEPNTVTGETSGLYCAVARIYYSEMDGSTPENDGWLIYIKPTLRGDTGEASVPYDVYSYSRSCKDFPHETTVDQWFSESQFESYRALGFHTLQQITGDVPSMTLEQFFDAVRGYVG